MIAQIVFWDILHAMTRAEVIALIQRLKTQKKLDAVFVLLKHLEQRMDTFQ